MEYLISVIVGYLLGSIPTAYIALKFAKDVDITEAGSGNMGAMNSYEVSGSRITGAVVLIIDLLKGLAAVWIIRQFYGEETFSLPGLAMVSAVLGHCFSVWIKFKGGRGLATAAGGSLLLVPPILIIWLILWVIAYLFRRNVHFGNIAATILTGAVSLTSGDILNKYSDPPAENTITFAFIVSLMLIIIMIKHIEPLLEWIGQRKKQIKER